MHHAIIATLAFAAGSAAAAAQPSDPQPATSPSTWMSIDDYPAAALASHQEGSVGFALAVDPTGQVQSCSITQSSGFPVLDDATCALLKSRAKFGPARDGGGHAVAGTFASHVQWVYPQPTAAAAALPTAINLQGFKRTGYGVSVLSVDENGLVTKCELGDSGYKNIPSRTTSATCSRSEAATVRRRSTRASR
jgi:protein TonB